MLAGAVVALVALVAGAQIPGAAALGMSMTLLLTSAGVLGGIADPRPASDERAGAGLFGAGRRRAARLIASAVGAAGVLLALAGGLAAAALALAVLGIGAWGASRARGTTLSWLPIAITIPLLPVYGWLGAAGTLPAVFIVLVPAAANAGAALAVTGAIVDLRRDEAAGISSIAVVLGPRRAAWVVLGLQVVVGALAAGTAAVLGAPTGWLVAVLLATGVPGGGAVLGLIGATRDEGTLRELAWELQAVGTGLLSVAWLGALSATGGARGL